MKLKKFDEINEARGQHLELPTEVVNSVDKLLKELKVLSKNYISEQLTTIKSRREHDKEFRFTITVPLTETFTKFVVDCVNEIGYKYNVRVMNASVEYDSVWLEIIDDEDTYIAPLICNTSADGMLFGKSDLRFSVWINTYVARKK